MPEYERLESVFIGITTEICIKTIQDEIWRDATITTLFHGISSYINSNDDHVYKFIFESDISAAEETQLDALITAHTGKPPALSSLDKQKTASKLLIDQSASEARSRYVSSGVAQDLVYQKKEENSRKFQADGNPEGSLASYPWVESEKNAANHATGAAAAANIIAIADGWAPIGAHIEELRIQFKKDIDATTDVLIAKSLGFKGKALLDAE